MSENSIILFGGSFDPIHVGHVQVARFALSTLNCKKIIFIPARCSPFKQRVTVTDGQLRAKMVQLSIQNEQAFEVSDIEMGRPGPSYTIDTVQYFRETYTDTEIFLLVGADVLTDLTKWYKINDLIDICNLTIMFRGGCPEPTFEHLIDDLGVARVEKLRKYILKTPLIDISSSTIRQRIKEHLPVEGMVHPDVLAFISQENLYQG